MSHNVADEKLVKDAKAKNKLEHEQMINDYRMVLEAPAGVRLIKHIIAKGSILTSGFTGNSTTYFNLGRKDIICQLITEIAEAEPKKLPELMFTFEDK